MTKPSEDGARNREYRPLCVNVRNYFKQYCEATSIHGFRYFGEDRSVFERLWWMVIFLLCLSGCSYMIYKIYEKYDTSPVIVTFSTTDTPIHNIPFPAVTICPETKSDRTIFNYTDVLERLVHKQKVTEKEKTHFHYMTTICDGLDLDDLAEDDEEEEDDEFPSESKQYFDAMNAEMQNETYKVDDFIQFLEDVKGDSFSIFMCKIGDKDCRNQFVPVITDEGICYSYNILDRSQIYSDSAYHYKNYNKVEKYKESWNIESGYSGDAGIEAYPRRALFSGVENGLDIFIGVRQADLDFVCKLIQGFKVVLHLPSTVPSIKQQFFRVSLDQAVLAAVQPSMITTSEKVKSFDVEKRKCYFATEKKLKYFKYYSQENCKLECFARYSSELSNCVSLNMPRDNKTEICGPLLKLFGSAVNLINQWADVSSNLEKDQSEYKDASCGCLPLCTDITYNTEISQISWDWEKPLKAIKINSIDKEMFHISRLTIYFKIDHFIAAERQELYGPTDFVANFGGLLGLFTGFSILSMMEIIYFLTLRICCNVQLYGRWNGVDQ